MLRWCGRRCCLWRSGTRNRRRGEDHACPGPCIGGPWPFLLGIACVVRRIGCVVCGMICGMTCSMTCCVIRCMVWCTALVIRPVCLVASGAGLAKGVPWLPFRALRPGVAGVATIVVAVFHAWFHTGALAGFRACVLPCVLECLFPVREFAALCAAALALARGKLEGHLAPAHFLVGLRGHKVRVVGRLVLVAQCAEGDNDLAQIHRLFLGLLGLPGLSGHYGIQALVIELHRRLFGRVLPAYLDGRRLSVLLARGQDKGLVYAVCVQLVGTFPYRHPFSPQKNSFP